jgi:hypothetical protein
MVVEHTQLHVLSMLRYLVAIQCIVRVLACTLGPGIGVDLFIALKPPDSVGLHMAALQDDTMQTLRSSLHDPSNPIFLTLSPIFSDPESQHLGVLPLKHTVPFAAPPIHEAQVPCHC